MAASTSQLGTSIRKVSSTFGTGASYTAIAICLATSALPAHAGISGGSITFSPADAAAIPTLGGSLLVLLAGLLALIAVKGYRRADRGIAPMFAGALAVGSLLSAAGGIDLIRQAHAGDSGRLIMNPQGQTFTLTPGVNVFLNDAGVPLEVVELTEDQCFVQPNESALPDCTVGLTIQVEEQCQVDVSCPG